MAAWQQTSNGLIIYLPLARQKENWGFISNRERTEERGLLPQLDKGLRRCCRRNLNSTVRILHSSMRCGNPAR
eukprot:11217034-Lingulodinium_polyedra.AAC.1